MDGNQNVSIDTVTIAKIAVATAYAMKLTNDGEVIGPAFRKVLESLRGVESAQGV